MEWTKRMRCGRWELFAALLALAACGGSIEGPGEGAPVAQERQVLSSEAAGETRWVRRGVGELIQQGYDVAVDREGNSVLVGRYQDAPDFGGGPLPAAAPDEERAFIVQYSPEGTLRWARGFGPAETPAITSFESVTVDRHDHITVLGMASAEVDIDGTRVMGTFLAQFDEDGSLRWARALPSESWLFPVSLATDREGNLFLSGSVMGAVDFGGGSRPADLEGSAFLVKYGGDGRYLWDRVFDTQGHSIFEGVATDSEGNVYVAGFFFGSASFGGPTFTAPAEGTAPVVVKYSPSGAHRWTRVPAGLSGTAFLRAVAVHGNRVVASGQFRGTVSFRGETFVGENRPEGLVLAYTRDGEERWARSLGWSFGDVAEDHRDDMTLLGFARAGDDVGTGPLPTDSHFVLKLDRVNGTTRWVRSFTGGNVLAPSALDVTREGEPVVGGYFSGTVDFGTGPLTADSDDAFLLRLQP